MKIRILLISIIFSLKCFSQSVSDFKVKSSVLTNPLKAEFKVIKDDSISISIYDGWGSERYKVLPKAFFSVGYYKIECVVTKDFTTGSYYIILDSGDKDLGANLISLGYTGSTNTSNLLKITCFDTVKVFDNIKVFDTTKVLVIDTLNCTKTTTNLSNFETFSKTESIVFQSSLTIDFSDVNKLVIYDLSGKRIKETAISGNEIPLQDLKNDIYIGLFYQDESIVKIRKLIKE